MWLLEQVAERTGLRSDLIKAFDGNKEMTDAILTMAMYQVHRTQGVCKQTLIGMKKLRCLCLFDDFPPCEIASMVFFLFFCKKVQSIDNQERVLF